MNFKNMSIKKSLIVGFGTTILVSLAIIIASLMMMNSQKGAYQDIIDHYVEANQRAGLRVPHRLQYRRPGPAGRCPLRRYEQPGYCQDQDGCPGDSHYGA